MKKILLFIMALTFTVGTLSGCDFASMVGGSSSSSTVEDSIVGSSDTEKDFYTVTFKQDGQEDIIKQVSAGQTLTDIPVPTQKTGYTTNWSLEDFSNISEDLTVTAVSTANKYTITYDAGDGVASLETQQVTYDEVPGSFATAVCEGYNFICWMYEGKAVQETDVWKIASDVTFVASWVAEEKCTVTFVQAGCEPITVEVVNGETLTGDKIPTPQPKEGYTVVWEEKIPSTITENIVINAVATPNTYYITYEAGEGNVDMALQSVVYDSAPQAFAVPTRDGYKFKGWEYEGKVLSASDVWTIAKDVTLTAKWAKICTITFNTNNGTLSQTTMTVVVGEAYTLPTPTRNEYTFTGWRYGSTKIDLQGTWTLEVDQITLDAKWSEDGWTNNY